MVAILIPFGHFYHMLAPMYGDSHQMPPCQRVSAMGSEPQGGYLTPHGVLRLPGPYPTPVHFISQVEQLRGGMTSKVLHEST